MTTFYCATKITRTGAIMSISGIAVFTHARYSVAVRMRRDADGVFAASSVVNRARIWSRWSSYVNKRHDAGL